MKKTKVSLLIKSTAFVLSSIVLIIYLLAHNFFKFNLFTEAILQLFFYLFLEFLPLILAIFSILISFTDPKFLIFLKNTNSDLENMNVYDGIIYLFIVNTSFIFIALILTIIILIFKCYSNMLVQAGLLFVYVYSITSLVNLVGFIFYFAKLKAKFVSYKRKV